MDKVGIMCTVAMSKLTHTDGATCEHHSEKLADPSSVLWPPVATAIECNRVSMDNIGGDETI